MSVSNLRGSTADGSNGVIVPSGANETSGNSNPIPFAVVVGNKSTYAEISRTGVASADTATTDLSTAGFAGSSGANLGVIDNAASLSVRATSSSASAVMQGRVVFYDSSNNPISLSELVTFTADATRRLAAAGDYVAQRWLLDAGQAVKCRFYVESISAGTWAVHIRPI